MSQRVEEELISDAMGYDKNKGMPHSKIEKLSAEEIVWHIQYLSKDKRSHVLWQDCAKWLELKMKEIRKLASYLESRSPND